MLDKNLVDSIRMMVARNELEEAFEELFGQVKSTAWASEVIMLSGRFYDLKTGERKKLIPFETASHEKNQIRNALLELLEHMENRRHQETLQSQNTKPKPEPTSAPIESTTGMQIVHSKLFKVAYRDIPSSLETELLKFAEEEHFVRSIEIGPYYDWVLIRDRNLFWKYGVPETLGEKLWEFYENKEHIKQVALGPAEDFAVIRGSYGYYYSGIPQKLADCIVTRYNNKEEINNVVLGKNGAWVLVYSRNGYESDGVSEEVRNQLFEFNKNNDDIKQVALGSNETFSLLRGNKGFYISAGVPQDFYDKMFELNKTAHEIKSVSLLDNGGWLILYV